MIRHYTARLSASILKRACGAAIVVVLSVGCSLLKPPNPVTRSASPNTAVSVQSPQSVLTQNLDKAQKTDSPNRCLQTDSFGESVKFATQASTLAQSANSQEEWDEVARLWVQAVAWMQAVPPNSPKRAFAEKKVAEYMRNLTYSQQQATALPSEANNPSFSSDLLDRQLQLYLSYVAAMGPPDILIVGSSRALQGVDPRQLAQSLASRGRPGLSIFNFGVNGATAQVVEFQLRKLLTPDQLPQLILWADGVRALNSGRVDRTFNSIATSKGNEMLAAGIRPKLPTSPSDRTRQCYRFPQPCPVTAPDSEPLPSQELEETTLLIRYPVAQKPLSLSPTLTLAQANFDESENTIDAHGFLALSERYNPNTYYRNRPFVSGRYDGDYQNFDLEGKQTKALGTIATFAKSRKIPLVFVNLPLTEDYLDSFRWRAEQQFQRHMKRLAQEKDFIFRDLSEKWLTRNDYFFDPSHLNRYGAQAVAQQLAIDSTIPWPQPRQKRGNV